VAREKMVRVKRVSLKWFGVKDLKVKWVGVKWGGVQEIIITLVSRVNRDQLRVLGKGSKHLQCPAVGHVCLDNRRYAHSRDQHNGGIMCTCKCLHFAYTGA
jgi:hypothetical protein